MIFINKVFSIVLVVTLITPIIQLLVKHFLPSLDTTSMSIIIICFIELIIVLLFHTKVKQREAVSNKYPYKLMSRFIIITQAVGFICGYTYEMFNIAKPEIEQVALTPIYILLLAPILEELIFRGVCIGLLKEYTKEVQILISAFAFGIFHMNFGQFFLAFIAGLFLAKIRIEYGLLCSICGHMLSNLLGGIIPYQYNILGLIIAIATIVILKPPNIEIKVFKESLSVMGVFSCIIFLIVSTLSIL